MIASGSVKLSYWAASTRNTNSTHSGKTSSRSVAGRDLLIREVGPLVASCRAAASRSRIFVDRRFRLAGAEARRGAAVDVGRRIAVVALHEVRPERLLDRDERAERHHLALAFRVFSRRCLRVRAERRVRLRDHLIGAAETVEVVDVQRAEVTCIVWKISESFTPCCFALTRSMLP